MCSQYLKTVLNIIDNYEREAIIKEAFISGSYEAGYYQAILDLKSSIEDYYNYIEYGELENANDTKDIALSER